MSGYSLGRFHDEALKHTGRKIEMKVLVSSLVGDSS